MRREPIAIKTISNYRALALYDIEFAIDNRVLAGPVTDTEQRPPRWYPLRYDENGDPYFKRLGNREYLSDFMRCNK